MNMKYGYGYVRVSTDKQDELSPDSQEKLLYEYAQKNHIILLTVFYEIGISGRTADKRPAFQEMIAAAKMKEHPVEVILVWKYSRFARNQEESIVYKSLLKKQHHIDVVSVSEPLIEGPFGSLIERIIEWMDEYYSIRLSGEVFRGMKENALRGAYQSRPPLGYRIMEQGTPLVIIPEEAQIITLVFSLYVEQGQSCFDIARQLNLYGYRTSNNKSFETRSVSYILQNPTYCGMICWNRTEHGSNRRKNQDEWILVDGIHPAIVSKERYYQAQALLANTHKSSGVQRPSSTYRHWLSGLLKCSACGCTLSANTRKKQDGSFYSYFTCYAYNKGKCTTCNGISSQKLEKEIMNFIQSYFCQEDNTFEYIHPLRSEYRKIEELIHHQMHSISEKEKRIKEAYINGIDSIGEYRENKKILLESLSQLEKELAMLDTYNQSRYDDSRYDDSMYDNSVYSDSSQEDRKPYQAIHNIYDVLISNHYSIAEKNQALRQIIRKIVYNREKNTLKIFLAVPYHQEDH